MSWDSPIELLALVALIAASVSLLVLLLRAWLRPKPVHAANWYAAEQLTVLSDLKRCGAVTKEEYERERVALTEMASVSAGQRLT
jgi:hypothetical protein